MFEFAHGVNWMPFGSCGEETKEKVMRLNTAFKESGISPQYKNTFAQEVHHRRFHDIEKLANLK